MQVQDDQLQYLIQLCRDKNIPEEEITKILMENSKSEFLKELENSFTDSKIYDEIPLKLKDFAKKYVEYVGTLMDPSRIYTTVNDEPNWPNPQVKKKEGIKFKKELLNFVLIMKNRALKKYLSEPVIPSKDNTPKSLSKSSCEKSGSKSLTEELESWDFKNDQEFTSKGPVSVGFPLDSEMKLTQVDSFSTDLVTSKEDLRGSSSQSSLENTQDQGKRVLDESSDSIQVPSKKIKKENNVQEEIKDGQDLQSLRKKVLLSRRNGKMGAESKKENDEISLEEGEISSDGELVKEEYSNGNGNGNSNTFNNHGNANVKRGRKYEHNNRYKKDDRREKPQSGSSSGTLEKHKAFTQVNPGMAPYLTYPGSGNVQQSNNYLGMLPFFRPSAFAMGYNQQYQPPNPYMQIDSNALAKAQMLANMSLQQTQTIFPQMSGTRTGGPALNRPMQYTNSNNFWMNMPHLNNVPGFAFAPGYVPQNGSFYSSTDAHSDTNNVYENPTSQE